MFIFAIHLKPSDILEYESFSDIKFLNLELITADLVFSNNMQELTSNDEALVLLQCDVFLNCEDAWIKFKEITIHLNKNYKTCYLILINSKKLIPYQIEFLTLHYKIQDSIAFTKEQLFKSLISFHSYLRQLEQQRELHQIALLESQNQQRDEHKIKASVKAVETELSQLQNQLREIETYGALLKQSLWHIHRSQSIYELETILKDILHKEFHLEFLKIVLNAETAISFQNTLPFEMILNTNATATFLVAKKNRASFSPSEKSFFRQISEAVEIALKRFVNLNELQELQEQWQNTFDSITKPIFLIDKNYKILNYNKEAKKLNLYNPTLKLSALNQCHKILFNRDTPCDDCHIKTNQNSTFQIKNKIMRDQVLPIENTDASSVLKKTNTHFIDKTYKVTSYKVKNHFLNIYEDITQLLQQQEESAQSAIESDLGVLSGSIAHELNNPIGGILTLSQVLKMDCENESLEHKSLDQIEQLALECKDIVENMLEFTHAQFNETPVVFDLIHIIKESLHTKNPFHKYKLEDHFEFETNKKNNQTNTQATYLLKNRPHLIAEIFYLIFHNLYQNIGGEFIVDWSFLANDILQIKIQSKAHFKFTNSSIPSNIIKHLESLNFKVLFQDDYLMIETKKKNSL